MNVRLRRDLEIVARESGPERAWVVKDPVSFQHFQFSDREYVLANLLDGDRSVQGVLAEWQARFQTRSLTENQVAEFIQRLITDNLVVVDGSGYGIACLEQDRRRAAATKGNWLRNPLAIRLRGVNPSVLLNEFDWFGKLMFHPVTILVALLTSLACLFFMLGNFEAVQERIPTIQQLMTSHGIVGMIIAIALVKMVHELGHAFACRCYGAECFEIGVMLLAGIPTLYTNVSDAWTIPERWKRIMVSFAGIYVEILIGAAAAVAWFLTPPGLLNALLFNVVLLCSINTLLVNGNPLLRYDGYFMLSDWLDQPNLAQRASSELTKLQLSAFRSPTGIEINKWMLLYGGASLLYRWFVVGVILFAIFSIAVAWNALVLGMVICGLLFLSLMLHAVRKQGSEMRMIGKKFGGVSLMRGTVSLLMLIVVVWMIFQVPLPRSVYCDFDVDLNQSHSVYAPNDGELIRLVSAFGKVEAGEVVARIRDEELMHQFETVKLDVDRQRVKLEQLMARNLESEEIAHLIEGEKKSLARTEAKLAQLEEKIQSLEIVSPQGGVVYPVMEAFAAERIVTDGLIAVGPSLRPDVNANRPVQKGQHLLTVAKPESVLVCLKVDENRLEPVAVGQAVRLRFDRSPNNVVSGTIEKIFDNDSLQERTDDGHHFRVAVKVDEVPQGVVPGSTGSAKISVSKKTLYERAVTLLQTAKNTRL